MRSIIGQCPECCECPVPTVQWDSRSASKYKYGASSWILPEAAIPVRYRKLTWSGAYTQTSYRTEEEPCDTQSSKTVITYSGYATSQLDAFCDLFSSLEMEYEVTPETGPPTTETIYFSPAAACPSSYMFVSAPVARVQSLGLAPSPTSDTVWGPVESSGAECESGSRVEISSTASAILSEEYTTADLIANTISALPAYDDDWDDTAGSYRNLTTDELTYSVRESRYRFIFPVPKVGPGTCYKIEWTERFTPDVGSVVDTPRCAIWNGDTLVAGTGLVGDGTNPYFELPIPSTNGTATVVDVVYTCRGCVGGC